jgi:hypothetical protein
MSDHIVTTESPTTPNGELQAERLVENPLPALEDRLQRLEDALAILQDTRRLEERIVERVSKRLKKDKSPGNQDPVGVVSGPAQENSVGPPLLLPLPESSASGGSFLRRPWVVFEAYDEARAILRMFFDSRYRATWVGRFVPPLILVAIMTSWLWLPGTSILPSFIATLIDKVVDLLLAFAAFKILSREAHRYRAVIADLPIMPHS